MRRVLLTAHKFFPQHRAGTEVLTLKIAQELQRRGSTVKVVAGNPPDLDARRPDAPGPQVSDYVHEGVAVHIFEESLRLEEYSFSYEYYHPLIKRHFLGLLDDFQPDIVLVVHAQNLSAAIVEACKEKGVPVVFYSTDFWFVCPIVQLTRPDGAVCRGPGPLAIKCLDCYTPKLLPPESEITEAIASKYASLGASLQSMPRLARQAASFSLANLYRASKVPAALQATLERPNVLRKLANDFAKIMVPTNLMRDIFTENGINSALIRHVPFGIDTSKLLDHQSKRPSPLLRIGYIGTFFEHKGVDLLIRAFLDLPAEFRQVSELKLYGDLKQFPEYGAKLKRMAEPGADKGRTIKFLGTFPNDELGSVLEEIDVLVVPSRWYENTPLVMQSALATRTPLIVTDLGGMAELVKHGENGLLFKLNDSNSLRAQLLSILKDRAMLKRMSENIKAERTVADMVDDIESVFEEVLTVRR